MDIGEGLAGFCESSVDYERRYKELEEKRDQLLEFRNKEVARHKQTVANSVVKLAKFFLDLEYNAWHLNGGPLPDSKKREHRKAMEAEFRKALHDCAETITLDDVENQLRPHAQDLGHEDPLR